MVSAGWIPCHGMVAPSLEEDLGSPSLCHTLQPVRKAGRHGTEGGDAHQDRAATLDLGKCRGILSEETGSGGDTAHLGHEYLIRKTEALQSSVKGYGQLCAC